MRIVPLLLIGLSALVLSACDEMGGSKRASADCCCKTCPTPPPVQPTSAPPAEEASAETVSGTQTSTAVHKRTAAVQRRAHRAGGYHATRYRSGGSASGRYRYRSGTEGVGYLDEDLAGGPRGGSYRRVEIDERETYSERYSASESSSAYASGGYSYSEGSYEASGGGYRRGGHKRRRDHDRGYVGTDRYGYLTWPGKTP